jgi:hypothetical protein
MLHPLSEDPEENLDRLIVEALENSCVWGLCDGEGNWAVAPSEDNDNIDVMPFWSDRLLAEPLCNGEWAVYRPTAIDLEEFLDEWLPGLHQDMILVGINWNADLEGNEMEPLDLLEEFEEDLG